MVKPDCFAFRQEKGVIYCDVLEDIYCKYQKNCRFYKTAQQYQTVGKTNEIQQRKVTSDLSSGSYQQRNVRCPFYKHDDGKHRITCEGLVDFSSLSLSYMMIQDYNIQITTYCCRSFEKCEIYQMLMASQYEE